MDRVRVRANSSLTDLARGEEATVDLDDRTRRRIENGLVSIVGWQPPPDEGDGLEQWTVPQLRGLADDLDLDVPSSARKAEVIEILREQRTAEDEEE